MDFKIIAAVLGPCVTFFLGILSERVKNRKQLTLDIEGFHRGNSNRNKSLSVTKNFTAEIDKDELISDFDIKSFEKKISALRENLKEEKNDKDEIISEFIADITSEFIVNITSKLLEKELFALLKNLGESEIDKDKLIADVVNKLVKPLPCINGTIVNTGRIPVAVQELRINFSKSSLDNKETGLSVQFLDKLLLKKIMQWLRWKKKVLISKLLPKKIKQWYATKVTLKMTKSSTVLHYSSLERGGVITLLPGESECIEISEEEIAPAMNYLDSAESAIMVYLSCKLVGEKKIRHSFPIFCGSVSFSPLGREITTPIFFISMEF